MSDDRLLEFSELSHHVLDAASVRLLPQAFSQRNGVVVLGKVDLVSALDVTVGVIDPDDRALMKTLSLRWARPVIPVRLTPFEIDRALQVGFGTNARSTWEEDRFLRLEHEAADGRSSAAELVHDVLAAAVRLGATDLHIESYAEDVDVRFRIDGVLRQTQTYISPANLRPVANRIKVLAGLDIADSRLPQDGRFRLRVKRAEEGASPEHVDFRVSTVPGLFGEDVVIRILGGQVQLMDLKRLGMPATIESAWGRLLENPEGLLLVTGPTGSGKTTTLYASLQRINNGARKILTAEDPIEVELPKVNQKQVSGVLTYDLLARAFLRQDPNVMLVGEIRDRETAIATVRAATTGHLVLSTLHTPDAMGALMRLGALDIEPRSVAECVLGILSQRLVRKVCTSCATPVPPSPELLALWPSLKSESLARGVGCEACGHSGYRGRIGLYELLLVDEQMQELLARSEPTAKVRAVLVEKGFRSLMDDARDKLLQGFTTEEEIRRVIPYRQILASREPKA